MAYPRTCEQVRAGHPDKLCDQIADAILDSILEPSAGPEPSSAISSQRCGLEILAKDNTVVLSGEVRLLDGTAVAQDYEGIVQSVVRSVGYDNSEAVRVVNLIGLQQPELQA